MIEIFEYTLVTSTFFQPSPKKMNKYVFNISIIEYILNIMGFIKWLKVKLIFFDNIDDIMCDEIVNNVDNMECINNVTIFGSSFIKSNALKIVSTLCENINANNITLKLYSLSPKNSIEIATRLLNKNNIGKLLILYNFLKNNDIIKICNVLNKADKLELFEIIIDVEEYDGMNYLVHAMASNITLSHLAIQYKGGDVS